MKPHFPTYRQSEFKDCGSTCIKIIKYYGKTFIIQQLRNLSETTREGSSLLDLSDAVEKVGFRSIGIRTSLEQLSEVPLSFYGQKLRLTQNVLSKINYKILIK